MNAAATKRALCAFSIVRGVRQAYVPGAIAAANREPQKREQIAPTQFMEIRKGKVIGWSNL